MDDYVVATFWMYGVICIMAFYGLSFLVLTLLGKNKKDQTSAENKSE